MCILVSVRGARPDGISLFDDPNRPLADLVSILAWNVLSGLQDIIATETTEPWPTMGPGRTMALPQVELRNGELHMWYGDETTVVVRLQPLPLANIVITPTSA
jgi:hypothetical protein